MDDHFPAGFHHPGVSTIWHPAPSPYGIPYRSLYSKNITNLLFAGRNISATHTALSSTRVMATCAVIGQAVGTAASIAVKHSLSPRGVYEERLSELKHTLMEDDCYLPFNTRDVSELTQNAALTASAGDPEILRNGLDRPIGDDDNGFFCPLNGWVEYAFEQPELVSAIRLVFDSDLRDERAGRMPSKYGLDADTGDGPPRVTPIAASMVKAFRIEARDEQGLWLTVYREPNNYQRLVRIPLELHTKALRLIPETTYGAERAHLFAFDLLA